MSIQKSKNKNIGGIASLQYVLTSEVSKFPTLTKYKSILFSDIVLKSGVVWKDIYFTPETCNADSENKNDDAGNFFSNTIKLKYPSENDETSIILEDIKDTPMLVLTQNLNGVKKLFGTPANPVRLQYNQQTDEAVMKQTGYDITISGAGIYPAIFIN
jgi:hypothetical protein